MIPASTQPPERSARGSPGSNLELAFQAREQPECTRSFPDAVVPASVRELRIQQSLRGALRPGAHIVGATAFERGDHGLGSVAANQLGLNPGKRALERPDLQTAHSECFTVKKKVVT
jgi:hypothetical protein